MPAAKPVPSRRYGAQCDVIYILIGTRGYREKRVAGDVWKGISRIAGPILGHQGRQVQRSTGRMGNMLGAWGIPWRRSLPRAITAGHKHGIGETECRKADKGEKNENEPAQSKWVDTN